MENVMITSIAFLAITSLLATAPSPAHGDQSGLAAPVMQLVNAEAGANACAPYAKVREELRGSYGEDQSRSACILMAA